MHFDKIDLKSLLRELVELPSEGLDERATAVIAKVKLSIERLRSCRPASKAEIIAELRTNTEFLDICRLFFGLGQESFAHRISEKLGKSISWPQLRRASFHHPEEIAAALDMLKLPALIEEHLSRQWKTEDILIERYKMTRGRAVAGQHRGRNLEDQVQTVLKASEIPFQRGVTFRGHKGQAAKCDFAIPTKDQPKIVVEAKGFEATGSKLTDFLGDVLKIGQAKGYHMYFFLVTDGRGWHNRISDLKKLIQFHNDGLIDMVYTRQRLADLAAAAKQIYENE